MFRLHEWWKHLKEMNGYIGFSFVMFLAGIVIGGTNDSFHAFLNGQMAGLQQLAEQIDQSQNKTLTMIAVIFFNNAIKAILMMYVGVFFGIIPVIFLLINGMVIGYLLQIVALDPDSPSIISVIFQALLPHGIIEIPAIVIACAYGMKFGTLILRAIGQVIWHRSRLAGTGKEIERLMIRFVPMAVVLIIALFIAAIIESTFTVWLASM
ncbi:stage II sporulation protein M [Paenibacillus sp. HB172176]|uniref:stage II sporulation protein M n=1 Tax=Paenibacillus sp. HB172176 TaxID=2493690 RepID=UPI001F0EBE29|nr:stage II sporulation protein M [Paenibacillus sp. HB172176]